MNARILNRPHQLAAGLLLAALGIANGPTASGQCVDYDPPPIGGPWACCGVTFFPDATFHETHPFRTIAGVPVMGGQAQIQNSCNLQTVGHSLNINNVLVRIDPKDIIGGPGGPGVRELSFWYQDLGGSVNLNVNGHLVFWHNDFNTIPPNEFNIVGVQFADASVWNGGGWEGWVTLTALPGGCIDDIAIGGQELCIDDICVQEECAPCAEDLDGDGTVATSDLLQLLAAWGPCGGCPEDLDGDGKVATPDLLMLLAMWGGC